jgi:hypothetical protein
MIAKPSLNDSLETGLLMAASEKRAEREPNFVRTVRSLQSSLASTNREIWRIFGEWEARILYSLDCVAERVGFNLRLLSIIPPNQRLAIKLIPFSIFQDKLT